MTEERLACFLQIYKAQCLNPVNREKGKDGIGISQYGKKEFLVRKIYEQSQTVSQTLSDRGAGRSIIGGGGIFIYSCSQTVKTIDFEI